SGGLAVGGRRARVEDVRLGPDPVVDRALEHLAVAPQREHPVVERREVEVRVDLGELAHLDSFRGNCLLTLAAGSGAAAGPLNCPPIAVYYRHGLTPQGQPPSGCAPPRLLAGGEPAVRRAYKLRAYPTRPQEGRAVRLLADHCDLYNAALAERREAWRLPNRSISYGDQSAQLKEIRA